MRKTKLFIILCLLVIFSSPISANVTATYAPASALVFETGSSPFTSTDFVAHIGTLTFYSSDNKLFDPALTNIEGNLTFGFTGQTTRGLETTNFRLASVYMRNRLNIQVLSATNGVARLTDTTANLNTAAFIVNLYFLSDQNSSIYLPGQYYTLTSGILNTFKGAFGASSGISTNIFPIPINNQTDPISFVPGPITSLPYVDPDNPFLPVNYDFTIVERQAFTIQNAFNTNASQIAQAQLIVTNAVPNTPYGINIEFRDTSNSANFALYLDGNALLYKIPYKLRFLNQEVVGNVPILWNNLSDGTFLQNISVTGIDPTTAGRAPSGSYSDVITVTITPIDTI